MVNAIVLLKIERQQINSVAQGLVEQEGVSEVYSVAGQYDLVAIIRTQDDEHLAELVTDHLLKLEGILSSETLIAFRVLSKYDLERLFSVGMS